MKGTMTVIKTDGTKVETPCTKPVPLNVLQKAVGGYIQALPGFEKDGAQCAVAYCNEEGKLQGLPYNAEATKLWVNALGYNPGDYVMGDVVLLTGDAEFVEG